MACAACSCGNKLSKQIKGITFHRFPKDPILRKAWILAIRRQDFEPGNRSVLCSEHFEKSDFEEGSNLQVILKNEAVPSIFKTHSVKPILTKKVEPGGGNACSVALCYSNSRKAKQEGLHLKFFTFPHDPALRKEWIRRCQRADKFDPKNRRICSLHFTKEDYEDSLQAQLMNVNPVKLKKDAVPSRNLPSAIKSEGSTLSQREQRYSEKLRKKVVEDCLSQYNEKVPDVNATDVLLAPSNKRGSITRKMKALLGEDCSEPEKPVAKRKVRIKRKCKSGLPKKRKNIYEDLKKHVVESRLGQHADKEKVSNIVSGNSFAINNTTGWAQINCLGCQMFQMEIDSLRKMNDAREQREVDLKEMLRTLQNKLTEPDSVFEEKAKEAFKDFLSYNQVNVVLKKKTKISWTQEDMSKAFSILYFSKQCYLHLRNTLHYPLPGLSTLLKWTSDMEKFGSTESEYLEKYDDDEHLTPEISSPKASFSFESQKVKTVGLEPCFPRGEPSDTLFEEDNSNGSLNLQNQQMSNTLFPQCDSSDPPVKSESQSFEDNSSTGSLNLGNKQIKVFCSKGSALSDQVTSKNAATQTNSAVNLKPVDEPASTNKGFKFQSYLQNYLKNRKQLRSLVTAPEKKKPFTCSVCNQGFDKNGSLKNHFKMHLPLEDQLKCDVCDKGFSSKFFLERHIETHKTDDKFVCDICDKSFLQKSTYKDHYVLHKNLKSQQIEKKEPEQCIVVYANADTPVADKHSSNNKYLLTRYPIPKKVKPYLCHICDELFDDKNSLKSHLPVHGENVRKAYKKQYTCELCNREFKYHYYFQEHLLKCAETVRFECCVCDKFFTSGFSLRKHMAMHETETTDDLPASTTETWFFCEICNNGFKQKCSLEQHMKKHLDEEPYVCNWCFKRFAHSDILKEHIKAHQNESFPILKKIRLEMPASSV